MRRILALCTALCAPGVVWAAPITLGGGGNNAALGPVVNAQLKCDWNFTTNTGTDNTVALQAAINAAQSAQAQGGGGLLYLPPGQCMSGPVTITGQIRIEGASQNASTLVLKHGSNAPLITFQPAGYNYPSVGYPNVNAQFANFRITSADGASTNATYPNAHGMSFPGVSGGGLTAFIYADTITVYNMPGNGIDSGPGTASNGFYGVFDMRRIYSKSNGGYGIATNSTEDWKMDGGELDGNYKDNWLSAGDGQLYIHNLNSYVSRGNGVTLYAPQNVYMDGHNEFNGNWGAGLLIEGMTAGSQVLASDVAYGNNGVNPTSPQTYGDVQLFANASNANIRLVRNWFPTIGGSSQPQINNVYFQNGAAAGSIVCEDCIFQAGNTTATGVTNAVSQISVLAVTPTGLGFSGSIYNANGAGSISFLNTQQYGGIFLNNASGVVAKIAGYSNSGDVGVIDLFEGGT